LSIEFASTLLNCHRVDVFRAVLFICPEEEHFLCLALGPTRVPLGCFGKVLPHLSVVDLHYLVQCQLLPHLLFIAGGIDCLLGLIWIFLHFILKKKKTNNLLIAIKTFKFWFFSSPLVAASSNKIISDERVLASTIYLIYSSTDAVLAFNGLITSLHSPLAFSKS